MHRFYLPPDQSAGAVLSLTSREAHHALHVLRVAQGERAIVLDGAGRELLCEVTRLGQDHVTLNVLQERRVPAARCLITLIQALPKGKLIESIIQMATELGVARIVPILSERVVTRINPDEAAARRAKWQLVAVEAIKQCGQGWLPRIDPPQTPEGFLARREGFELALVGSLQNDSRHPREYFRAFQEAEGRNPKSLSIWVGPEGDFTPAELTAMQSAGAQPITLGPLVLRAETAAIYCLSVLNYELQWPMRAELAKGVD